jgi:hypothetical protein
MNSRGGRNMDCAVDVPIALHGNSVSRIRH